MSEDLERLSKYSREDLEILLNDSKREYQWNFVRTVAEGTFPGALFVGSLWGCNSIIENMDVACFFTLFFNTGFWINAHADYADALYEPKQGILENIKRKVTYQVLLDDLE